MNPSSIRSKLAAALGQDARTYWRNLSQFISGDIPRYEFDENIRECISTPELGERKSLIRRARLKTDRLITSSTP